MPKSTKVHFKEVPFKKILLSVYSLPVHQGQRGTRETFNNLNS